MVGLGERLPNVWVDPCVGWSAVEVAALVAQGG